MEDDRVEPGPLDEEALERLHRADDAVRAVAAREADVEDRAGRRRPCGGVGAPRGARDAVAGLVGERRLDVAIGAEALEAGRLLVGRDRLGGA